MSDDETRGHVLCLWIIAGILIFVISTHSVIFSELTERVDALEQLETSEAQQ